MKRRCRQLFTSEKLCFVLATIFAAAITFVQLQVSVSSIPIVRSSMSLGVMGWNIFTIWLIMVILIGLINRVGLGILLWCVIAFGVSIANYYVLLFHGSPLTFYLLKNLETAIDVISSYRFSADLYSLSIVMGFVICIGIVCWVRQMGKRNKTDIRAFSPMKRLGIIGAAAVLLLGNIYAGVFSDFAFKPEDSVGFSWTGAAGEYGFIPLQLETHFQKKAHTLTYDGYSEEEVLELYDRFSSPRISGDDLQLPDLILILNESFFDLRQIADLNMNVSPLSHFEQMEQVISGYAVAPDIGGGTNRTEYELLTSVSTSLLPNLTPFQAMDVAEQCSIVSFLEALGYETLGAHCARAANYNRGYSYPALGFDRSYFIKDFENLAQNGNRAHTDASVYQNVINWYEESSDQPKFMYVLTYQNHGGWDQNPREMDTVWLEDDTGKQTDEINEYLSSLQLSDLALQELLGYFDKVDREVLVCMVGDHAPSFAQKWRDPSVEEEEMNYLLRGAPFVIWSNHGLKTQDLGHISMNYLVPTLLEAAGIPLSPFYRYQLDIMDEIPLITSYDTYYDKRMDAWSFETDSVLSQKVHGYLNMCFNNFQDNRYRPLFEPGSI